MKSVYKNLLLLLIIIIPTGFIISNSIKTDRNNPNLTKNYKTYIKTEDSISSTSLTSEVNNVASIESLYEEMDLSNLIDNDAFVRAVKGYYKLNKNNNGIFTLIDFTKPSTEKRFFVIDMLHKKIIFSTFVSHGKNSGENYATSFSNTEGSYKSSLGFFITENTYIGKNGYSLVLNGLENGFNNMAKKRAVVIHGADYANPDFISTTGRLGRSYGCPALPRKLSKKIIDTIKNGTLLFIYAKDKNYLQKSNILNT